MKYHVNRAGIVTAVATGLLALSPPASAHSAFVGGYNKTAASVASAIDCAHPRLQSSGGMTKTGLVCDLRGKRVNVITFSTEAQQVRWLDMVDLAYPRGGYVAVARGVVIVARDGNRAAASSGAAALNGAVVPVG